MQTQRYSICNAKLYQKDWYADMYGSYQEGYWARRSKEFANSLDLEGKDVVDLGCGTGYVTRPLLERAKHVYAIDPSRAMLNVLYKQTPAQDRLTVIHGTIEDFIPLKERVAMILSHGVFVTLPSPLQTLKRIYSFLEEEEKFIFSMENWEGAHVDGEPVRDFIDKQRRLQKRLGLENPDIEFYAESIYRERDVLAMIQAGGGKICNVTQTAMAFPAKDHLDLHDRCSWITEDIERLKLCLKKGSSVLRKQDILSLEREIRELEKQQRGWEKVAALYEGKTWFGGTQYIFFTESLRK